MIKVLNNLLVPIAKGISKIQAYRNDPVRIVNVYRSKGIKIGKNAYIYSWCLDTEFPQLIEIGDNVCISANVRILSHDASLRKIGWTKYGGVHIGNDAFIGYGSVILPNTYIGNDVIIGAGAVVKGTIPDDSIVVGNPCKIIRKTSEYYEKAREKIEKDNVPINSIDHIGLDNIRTVVYMKNDSVTNPREN